MEGSQGEVLVSKARTPYRSFGRWLRHRREDCDLTQLALADRIGIVNTSLSQYESGLRLPTVAACNALALALNIDPDIMLAKAALVRLASTDEGQALLRTLATEHVDIIATLDRL